MMSLDSGVVRSGYCFGVTTTPSGVSHTTSATGGSRRSKACREDCELCQTFEHLALFSLMANWFAPVCFRPSIADFHLLSHTTTVMKQHTNYKRLLLPSHLWLCLRRWILVAELHRHRVHAMSLVGRRRVALILENMAQMSATICANYLYPLHAESLVAVPCHCTRYCVEERWPPAARLELLVCAVEWRIAGSTVVSAGGWVVLIVVAAEGRFGAFLSYDAELFCRALVDAAGILLQWCGLTRAENCLPLAVALLHGMRHLPRLCCGK
jgi:hypothetical protein